MNGPAVLFLTIVVGVTIGISLLVFVLMRKVFDLYHNAKFTYFFWTINLVSITCVAFGRGRLDSYPLSGFLVELIVSWFMAQVIALFLLPLYFILRKMIERHFSVTAVPVDLTRRKFIQGMALSLPAAALGISAYGTFSGSREIRLLAHDIRLSELDDALSGFKIAQISDVHIGLFFSVAKLQDILRTLVDARADVLLITGDLIDDVHVLPELIQTLNEFAGQFPGGIYFSWGNHEYFRNFSEIERGLNASKIHVLRNESALLVQAQKPLYLIGVDYPWEKEAEKSKAECNRMLHSALTGVPQSATRVLMSHHPELIDYGYDSGIDLALTGHTHGGQFALFGQAVLPVRYKYMRGMYTKGTQYAYVSTGAGSWFPFRLGCPAEITIFTLQQQ